MHVWIDAHIDGPLNIKLHRWVVWIEYLLAIGRYRGIK